MGWTPHELPFLVEQGIRDYNELEARFSDIATPYSDPKLAALLAGRRLSTPRDSAAALDDVRLSWLDKPVCELIEATVATLPEWTPAECIPHDRGLVGLSQPIDQLTGYSLDSPLAPYPVSAISWNNTGTDVTIRGWIVYEALPKPWQVRKSRVYQFEEALMATLPVNQPAAGGTEQANIPRWTREHGHPASGVAPQLTAVVGAIWLLMAQPKVLEEAAPAVVNVKRRNTVTRRVERQPVRVSVRTLTGTTPQRSRSSSTGQGRKATTRWWVRGHWRQQAYGQGRKLRKPVYIAPHTAGAADTPVDTRPQVQVWKTGQDAET